MASDRGTNEVAPPRRAIFAGFFLLGLGPPFFMLGVSILASSPSVAIFPRVYAGYALIGALLVVAAVMTVRRIRHLTVLGIALTCGVATAIIHLLGGDVAGLGPVSLSLQMLGAVGVAWARVDFLHD
jgi:peptidoglycan/LPS O-acetylase OafA/YrhL